MKTGLFFVLVGMTALVIGCKVTEEDWGMPTSDVVIMADDSESVGTESHQEMAGLVTAIEYPYVVDRMREALNRSLDDAAAEVFYQLDPAELRGSSLVALVSTLNDVPADSEGWRVSGAGEDPGNQWRISGEVYSAVLVDGEITAILDADGNQIQSAFVITAVVPS